MYNKNNNIKKEIKYLHKILKGFINESTTIFDINLSYEKSKQIYYNLVNDFIVHRHKLERELIKKGII